MAFFALPPELKLHIVEFMEPGPTLHFALTSKEHYELSKNQLKEHAMFTKYSVIQTTFEGALVWDFTKEVLLNPRLGWYVRELNLIVGRPDVHANMSEEDRSLFRTAAKKLLPLYSFESSFFAHEKNDARSLGELLDDSNASGSEDAILVILVHHLAQLRIFRMADSVYDGCFSTFMRQVAAGYQNPTLAPRMPLQHLRAATIVHSDTEFCCDIDWAVYFVCVPSLQTFAAYMMGSEGVGEFQADVETDEESDDEAGEDAHLRLNTRVPVSNVEELLFYQCQFDPQSFNMLLPMFKNLKRFTYLAAGQHCAYANYEARKVIRALSNHVSHSLEELQLKECGTGIEECEEDLPFVSARGFQKLKALQCETRWLLPMPTDDDLSDGEALSQGFHVAEEEPKEEMKDPRDNLPESLEYLWLDGSMNGTSGKSWKEWSRPGTPTHQDLRSIIRVSSVVMKSLSGARLSLRSDLPLRTCTMKCCGANLTYNNIVGSQYLWVELIGTSGPSRRWIF